MTKHLKPLGTARLGTTPAPDGVGFLVSRFVLVAVPRLSVLCLVVSLNVHAVSSRDTVRTRLVRDQRADARAAYRNSRGQKSQ